MNEHDEKNGILNFPGNDPDLSPDNSDIEALYREAASRGVPDFWSKIESGLDDPRYADGFAAFEPAEGVQAEAQNEVQNEAQGVAQSEEQTTMQTVTQIEAQTGTQTETQNAAQTGIQDGAFHAAGTGMNGSMNQVSQGTPAGTNSSADRFAAYVQNQEAAGQRITGNAQAGNSGNNSGNTGRNSGKKKRFGFWIGGLAAAAVVIIISAIVIANSGKRTKSDEYNTSTLDMEYSQAKAESENAVINEDVDGANESMNERHEQSQKSQSKSEGTGAVQESQDKDSLNGGANSYAIEPGTQNDATIEAEQAEAPAPRDSTESMLPESEKQDPKLYKDEIGTLGISLRLQNVRSTGCILMFTRDEDTENETGTIFSAPEYEIETWNGSSWEIYPHVKDITFGDEQWAMVKGKINTYVAYWWLDYGSLVAGKYRIIKMLYTDREYNGYDAFRIAAEFDIY